MRFVKLSGAGNDFILLEAPPGRRSFSPAQIRRLCDRQQGVGADGILWVRPENAGVRLRYWNADGSRASFCGNGARCAAFWAGVRSGKRTRARVRLLCDSGTVEAELLSQGRVRLALPPPRDWRLRKRVRVGGRSFLTHFVRIGVPHVVVEYGDLERFPVAVWGRRLRKAVPFRPEGANVNFVRFEGGRRASLRTYERGVEGETLACGTGAAASAAVGFCLGKLRSPARCRVRSGQVLTVGAQRDGSGEIVGLWQEGPVQVVFRGEISL
ncbi:MAG: diaminopimelate epimerase [Elusimicrobia bacterium]|nr:diaminopimelate epimerase [Elusimicrobiota bacterium]